MKNQELVGTAISYPHYRGIVTKNLNVRGSRGNTTGKTVGRERGISFMEEPLVTKGGIPRAVVRDDACG